ncbi:MAG: copper resistance protein NlpE N-terminal domain-containing protein [Flavobacterium sp.]|uniref:copper resistance protein NlpE n=1 Tax=Flavobacterium sp. TaxID=239 RepID=UPI001AFFD613|nr:copper resistance protein NlpE [Flavobacterium sp.]MBO9583815.1 copper resistance protein NlpE N-terminal domain-containing protein [Flavobacterium sp.]
MKTKILTLALFSLVLTGCESKKTQNEEKNTQETEVMSEDNSKNSLNWSGVYKGVIPCADCEGIEEEITLTDDGNFTKKSTYLGKEKENIFTDTGVFTWDKTGSIITTITKDKSSTISYQVGENKLIQLDNENKVITGPLAEKYILNQIEVKHAQ